MFNDEKRKFKDIVYRLETINSKIENLNTSIEDLENTFEDSLKIDDEIFEKKRIDTTKKDLTSAANTIKNTIIPSIKRKIKD